MHGKRQHHLIHLGLAVPPHRQNTILIRRKHGDDLFGRIALRQIVSRAMIQQIAQQHNLIRFFLLHAILQFSAEAGGTVNVRCNEKLHTLLLLSRPCHKPFLRIPGHWEAAVFLPSPKCTGYFSSECALGSHCRICMCCGQSDSQVPQPTQASATGPFSSSA